MRAKKIVYFLIMVLLFSGLMCRVDALSTSTVSFHGVRVTVDLTFPEEANPSESIWHNATITASTALFLRNLTVVIKALVNSSWQEVFIGKDERNIFMQENASFPWDMGPIPLPEETNGKLHCFIHVNTSQSVDYAAFAVYTTLVSEPTFSEMQILYYDMLANYTTLQANYTTLLNEHDSLLANYTSLFAIYTTLLNVHNQLLADYNQRETEYNTEYDALNAKYTSQLSMSNDLQLDYDSLNSTHINLQTTHNTLQAVYYALNLTYTGLLSELGDLQVRFDGSESAVNADRIVMFIFTMAVAALVAFIIYLKRIKQEPYVVIRKETVGIKPDKGS